MAFSSPKTGSILKPLTSIHTHQTALAFWVRQCVVLARYRIGSGDIPQPQTSQNGNRSAGTFRSMPKFRPSTLNFSPSCSQLHINYKPHGNLPSTQQSSVSSEFSVASTKLKNRAISLILAKLGPFRLLPYFES